MARITLHLFAQLRERRGVDTEELEIELPVTAAEAYAQLFPPGPEGVLPVGFAVNHELVAGSTPLHDGDELAFIPPVGGG
jgi:molybdopterin converting factor small subunit